MTQWGVTRFLGIITGIYPVPSHFYVALCNTQPGQTTNGTSLSLIEPPVTAASTAYARQVMGSGGGAWALSDSGYVSNVDDIDFGSPDTNWGYTPYYALCDALINGNVYGFGEFSNPLTLAPGPIVKLPAATMTLRGIALQPSIVS